MFQLQFIWTYGKRLPKAIEREGQQEVLQMQMSRTHYQELQDKTDEELEF